MDKFILYKENIDLFDNFINSVGGALFSLTIAGAILYCTYDIARLFFTPAINNKERFLPIIRFLILAIILHGLNVTSQTEKVKNYNHQFEEQKVKLSDIKELIHVDGDKLTIDPLTNKSKNYYYNSERYKNNERQLFKIDHDDYFEEYQLIDKKNNKIKIKKE